MYVYDIYTGKFDLFLIMGIKLLFGIYRPAIVIGILPRAPIKSKTIYNIYCVAIVVYGGGNIIIHSETHRRVQIINSKVKKKTKNKKNTELFVFVRVVFFFYRNRNFRAIYERIVKL